VRNRRRLALEPLHRAPLPPPAACPAAAGPRRRYGLVADPDARVTRGLPALEPALDLGAVVGDGARAEQPKLDLAAALDLGDYGVDAARQLLHEVGQC